MTPTLELQQQNTTDIHTRALLVYMNISMWSARRYDKTITQKINTDYRASDDAGRYNKMLLPGNAPTYKALTTLASQIRNTHYTKTLTWSDEGWRLLPTANYMAYTDWLRSQERQFQAALDAFVAEYPALKLAAQTRLNGMYQEEDYPALADIRKRFNIAVSYMPVPAHGDIRVDLASDQVSAIEESVTASVATSIRNAVSDAWQRLHTVTNHLAQRLADPDATFRNATVDNVRDCCDALRRLNVTNDPQLESMRQRVEHDLAFYSAEDLRVTPVIRKDVADKAQAILDTMRQSGYLA